MTAITAPWFSVAGVPVPAVSAAATTAAAFCAWTWLRSLTGAAGVPVPSAPGDTATSPRTRPAFTVGTQDWAARSSPTTTSAEAFVPAWLVEPATTTTNRTTAANATAATVAATFTPCRTRPSGCSPSAATYPRPPVGVHDGVQS